MERHSALSLSGVLVFIFLTWGGLAAGRAATSHHALQVEIRPRFNKAPLVFDSLTNTLANGQKISVTRLDYLVSSFALHQRDGGWLTLSNRFAYVSGREGRNWFRVDAIPEGSYDRIRFDVGVPVQENHEDPAHLPPDHALNPNLNGLHWSWQGGYIFLAIEGDWLRQNGKRSGYSYHLATDRLLRTITLPVALELSEDRELLLGLEVGEIFSGKHRIALSEDTTSTHSREQDELAGRLQENLAGAFVVDGIQKAEPKPLVGASRQQVEMAATARLYRYTFARYFPQPLLPVDNPMTVEGVELGRRLFEEPLLSINNKQSCRSCHQPEAAFADPRRLSLGAEGQIGSRNAMPLLNLAWKKTFFWDGRSSSLRDQVLQPIQDPLEMHETLANVEKKLTHAPSQAGLNYSNLFARAFGTPVITADRIARGLEQFLLAQVSYRSAFDRSLAGETELNAEEKRGFELFNTEYDPRRNQLGADCFHCHGGPLFQSQSFANNGLDEAGKDLGRFGVTGRPGDKNKFAVPTLRNVALSAPYMHDGRFETLEQVVAHYSSGIRPSPTLDPNLAKHPEKGLNLSLADQKALVAFLRTLTDTRRALEKTQP